MRYLPPVSSARSILASTDHRPWPAPRNGWSVFMRWHDLLFAHWRVDHDAIRPLIPDALELETFDRSAWVGVVPFHMSGIRHRLAPAIPGARRFPELNVRTYVRERSGQQRTGVWFFSLDAAHRLAVEVARRAFHLNYCTARITCDRAPGPNGGVVYETTRTDKRNPTAELSCGYRPIGPAFRAEPGSLEHWLTERYCMYAASAPGPTQRVWCSEIHHEHWSLRPAAWTCQTLDMTRLLGIELEGEPESLLFADRIDAIAWMPRRV